MGSMHTGLEDRRRDFPKLAHYFKTRSKGGVALMVTGGFSPNIAGCLSPMSSRLSNQRSVDRHRQVVDGVHEHEGKICLQILHAGRYGYTPLIVAPSPIKSPISPFAPRELSERAVAKTVRDFVNTAELAKVAGYDGVEIMGSEGYLINQFIAPRTNHRKDRWGGDFEGRSRLAVEIVKQTRKAVGEEFIIIF